MLALERHPVCCLLHLHLRMTGQQIDHHARMRRIEMLDQNEGHAGAGGERAEQAAEGIEAAGGGAEPDHREVVMPECRTAPGRRTPARPRASRFGLMRTLSCHSNARSSFSIAQRRSFGNRYEIHMNLAREMTSASHQS